MGRDAEGLEPPVAQTVERANANAPETCRVGPLRRFHAPLEVPLRADRVHVGIDGAVIGFLIDHQAFRAGLHQWAIFRGFHGPDLQREARHLLVQEADALGHVIRRDELGMLARHEQDIAEALPQERPRLAPHFLRGERDAQDWVVARKAAVLAGIDALVGEIERGKETNDFAKALLRHLPRAPAKRFQQLRGGRGNQMREISQRQLRFAQAGPGRGRGRRERAPEQGRQRQGVKFSNKTHNGNLAKAGEKSSRAGRGKG